MACYYVHKKQEEGLFIFVYIKNTIEELNYKIKF